MRTRDTLPHWGLLACLLVSLLDSIRDTQYIIIINTYFNFLQPYIFCDLFGFELPAMAYPDTLSSFVGVSLNNIFATEIESSQLSKKTRVAVLETDGKTFLETDGKAVRETDPKTGAERRHGEYLPSAIPVPFPKGGLEPS